MFSKKLRLAFLWFFLTTAYVLSERTISIGEPSLELSPLINEEKHEGSEEDISMDESKLESTISEKSEDDETASGVEGTVSEPESSIIGDSTKLDETVHHESSPSEVSSLLGDSITPQHGLSKGAPDQSDFTSESSLIGGSESEEVASEASRSRVSSFSPKSHEESLMLLEDPNYTVEDAFLLLEKQRKIQNEASGKKQSPFVTPLTSKETGSRTNLGKPLLSRLTREASPLDFTSKHSISEPSVTEHSSKSLPVSVGLAEVSVDKSHRDSDLGDEKLDLKDPDYDIDVSTFETDVENEPTKEESQKDSSENFEKSVQPIMYENESEIEKTASASEEKSSEFVPLPLTQREEVSSNPEVSVPKVSDGLEIENEFSEENEVESPLIEQPAEILSHQTESTLTSENSTIGSSINEETSVSDNTLQRRLLENSGEDLGSDEQSLENALGSIGVDHFYVSDKDATIGEKKSIGVQTDEFVAKEISPPNLEVQKYDENEHKSNKLRGILLPVSELFQTCLGCASPCPYRRFIVQSDRVLKSISKFEAKALELYNIIKKAREITIKEVSDIFKFHETAIKRRALLFVQKYAKGIRVLLFKIDSAKKTVFLALKTRILLQLLPTKNSNEYSQEALQRFHSNIELVSKEYDNVRSVLNSKTMKYGLMKYLSLNENEYSIEPIKVVLERELFSFSSKMLTFQKFVSRHRNLALAVADLMKKAGYPVKKRFFMIDRKGLTKEQQRLYKKKVNEDKKMIRSKLNKRDYRNFKKAQEKKWSDFSNNVQKRQ
ncbi:hypothetical protein FG379_003719 [Cryptosporidium bovis]|uniref:uncharacterized protein n=1 Tax=Cryptosporidium bovis TaxID=310047 RepID=UPI00351A2EDB|nr:hypothetical protein FG379_003719 [Cryptosporidium bovis]